MRTIRPGSCHFRQSITICALLAVSSVASAQSSLEAIGSAGLHQQEATLDLLVPSPKTAPPQPTINPLTGLPMPGYGGAAGQTIPGTSSLPPLPPFRTNALPPRSTSIPAPAAVSTPLPATPLNSSPAISQMDGHVRNAIGFYGRTAQATQSLQQAVVQRPAGSVLPATATRPTSKPFEGVSSGPTVSPYLNLYREERGETAPNYYAFVRPQQQQIETNQKSRLALQTLRRQVQRTQRPGSAGAMPSSGSRSRYMDTGRYYNR